MFGSCSQPIKANKILSCGTRDSQHGVRNSRFSTFSKNRSNKKTTTYDSPISTRVRRHANCEFPLHGVRNSRSSTFNQNSSNKEMTTCDLHSRPSSMRTACELPICSSRRTELEIFNIQSEQQQPRKRRQQLANLHSCPPSVQTACELRICSSWK